MNHRVSKCRPVLSSFAGATQFMASAVSPEALEMGYGLRISKSRPDHAIPEPLNSPSPEVLHKTAFPGMLDRVNYVLHVASPSPHGTEKHYFLLAVTGTTAHRKKRANAQDRIGRSDTCDSPANTNANITGSGLHEIIYKPQPKRWAAAIDSSSGLSQRRYKGSITAVHMLLWRMRKPESLSELRRSRWRTQASPCHLTQPKRRAR
ncbi:hypothetical protein GB937_009250 [Aspergillus fischeri]|nr:hypothetical protein GB937_009250 [Aspergillus fischeri]